ncbi:MAG: hypothetical protein ACFFDO_07155 [Candidatus Thorarchaeota archaeon]
MVLLQMDLVRIIQIYVVQLGMGLVYIFFGILILKRDTKRLNQIFATFYLLSASATVINVIYASLTIEVVVKVLHFITYFLFCYAPLYLLIFCLIIWKSEKVVTIKTHNIIAIIYFILLLILAPIALFTNGITINESTNWRPVWNLPFMLYAIIVVGVFIIIPLTYLLIQIYKSFEDKVIQRRWLFFILGILPYFVILYLVSISNFLNDPIFRLITSIAGLSLYATAVLLYYGVGRQLKK